MKERIRNWYYLFVGEFFMRMYERVWYYMVHTKYNWMRKLSKKALDELVWNIVDNHMDFIRNEKRNCDVEMTFYSEDEKSPFYGGNTLHARYDLNGRLEYAGFELK